MQAYQFRAEEKNVFSDLSKIFYNGAAVFEFFSIW